MEKREFAYKKRTVKIGKYTLERPTMDNYMIEIDKGKKTRKKLLITKHAKKLLESMDFVNMEKLFDSILNLMEFLNLHYVWLKRMENSIHLDFAFDTNHTTLRNLKLL